MKRFTRLIGILAVVVTAAFAAKMAYGQCGTQFMVPGGNGEDVCEQDPCSNQVFCFCDTQLYDSACQSDPDNNPSNYCVTIDSACIRLYPSMQLSAYCGQASFGCN